MNIYIIRHGESEENSGVSSSGDAALTPRGREQARRTGRWLAGVYPQPTRIFVSPATRTLETARLIRDALAVSAVVDPDLCERGLLYDNDGLSGDEILSRFGSTAVTAGTELLPELELPAGFPKTHGWARGLEGETKPAFVARVDRVVSRYLGGYGDGNHGDRGDGAGVHDQDPRAPAIALVTHAHIGGFILGRLLDVPEHLLSKRRLRHMNCGVSRIEFTESYRQLHFANATWHLGDQVSAD